MISATIQIHYTPEFLHEHPGGQVITSTGVPFASLRLGPQVSLLISDAHTLDLIADAARDLATQLRDAQVTS